MKELSKSVARRLREPNFISRYFVGQGIDIGGFPDPFSLYKELFPLVTTVRVWDKSDGDAQFLEGIVDESNDFILSSHCLEHLNNPFMAVENWFRCLKPNGHLVVTVPEEDLYEQGKWPSSKNQDHKWTFTIFKRDSWSPKSINVLDLLSSLGPLADIRSVKVEDSGYRYSLPKFDQTLTPIAESSIEFIVRKRTTHEIRNKSNFLRVRSRVDENLEVIPYLNQYLEDYEILAKHSREFPPFRNFQDNFTYDLE